MTEATETERSQLWIWWVCGLLLLASTINYMDRQTLSNTAVRIKTELNLNNEQYGSLETAFGLAFAVASSGYLVGTGIAVRVVMIWGSGRTMGVGAIIMALGGLATIAATAIGWNLVAALIVTVGIYMIGMGMVLPQAQAGALDAHGDHRRAADQGRLGDPFLQHHLGRAQHALRGGRHHRQTVGPALFISVLKRARHQRDGRIARCARRRGPAASWRWSGRRACRRPRAGRRR